MTTKGLDQVAFDRIRECLIKARGEGPLMMRSILTTREVSEQTGIPVEAARPVLQELARQSETHSRHGRAGPEYWWRNAGDRASDNKTWFLAAVTPLLNAALCDPHDDHQVVDSSRENIILCTRTLRRLLTDPRAAALVLDALDMNSMPTCQSLPHRDTGVVQPCCAPPLFVAKTVGKDAAITVEDQRLVCGIHEDGARWRAERDGLAYESRPLTLADVLPQRPAAGHREDIA